MQKINLKTKSVLLLCILNVMTSTANPVFKLAKKVLKIIIV